jgi:uncharacterized protein (TIGR03086 family)
MTETSDRYRHLAEGFTARLDAVPDDAWNRQSPCEDWKAHDVVEHVAGINQLVLDRAGETYAGPAPESDGPAAFRATRDAVQKLLDEPARAAAPVQGLGGTQPLEQFVGSIICTDLLIHTWDLARAAGLDDRLDPAEVHRSFEMLEPMDEPLRQRGSFHPKVEPPPGADEQTRLICFTGRRVT